MLTAEERRAVIAQGRIEMAHIRAEMAEAYRLNAEHNRRCELAQWGVGDLRRDEENEDGTAEADHNAKYGYEDNYSYSDGRL